MEKIEKRFRTVIPKRIVQYMRLVYSELASLQMSDDVHCQLSPGLCGSWIGGPWVLSSLEGAQSFVWDAEAPALVPSV